MAKDKDGRPLDLGDIVRTVGDEQHSVEGQIVGITSGIGTMPDSLILEVPIPGSDPPRVDNPRVVDSSVTLVRTRHGQEIVVTPAPEMTKVGDEEPVPGEPAPLPPPPAQVLAETLSAVSDPEPGQASAPDAESA